MAKGASEFAVRMLECQEVAGEYRRAGPWPTVDQAERRVLEIQTKLHRWATDDPDRRFDDLFNLVDDPAFLVVAWDRVRGNKGARIGRGGRADRPLRRGRARGRGVPRPSCGPS